MQRPRGRHARSGEKVMATVLEIKRDHVRPHPTKITIGEEDFAADAFKGGRRACPIGNRIARTKCGREQ